MLEWNAQAAQEGKLRDKLAKKRRKREEQLKRENANAETIEVMERENTPSLPHQTVVASPHCMMQLT